MSSFKHVTKQRKLIEAKRELHLSDEESSGDSESESEDSASDSEGDEGSQDGSDDEEDEEDEDEGMEGEDDDEEKEVELLPPPEGFPTALAATKDPIALPVAAEGEEDIVPVCVVCPSKLLKAGKMLEVHLGSKDHVRRLKRFTSHVLSSEFPPSSLPLDARSISAQLDALVLERLSLQTQFGGATSSTSAPSAPSAPTPAAVPIKKLTPEEQVEADRVKGLNQIKNEEAEERKSKREELRLRRAERNDKMRKARREKAARLATAKAAKGGEELTKVERKTILKEVKKANKTTGEFTKPTPEQIAARQAKKLAARAKAPLPDKTTALKPTAGTEEKPKAWKLFRKEKKEAKLKAKVVKKEAPKAGGVKRSREGKAKEGKAAAPKEGKKGKSPAAKDGAAKVPGALLLAPL